MSITFSSNAQFEVSYKEAPCLCAQMADSFSAAFRSQWTESVRQDLRENAESGCRFCGGSGVEKERHTDLPEMNLANLNALLLLEALGIEESFGSLPVHEARRALMRAKSRSSLQPFTRQDEVLYGRPQAKDNGVVELRPVRVRSMGVDENRMASYIERFSALVEESASRGATEITWG